MLVEFLEKYAVSYFVVYIPFPLPCLSGTTLAAGAEAAFLGARLFFSGATPPLAFLRARLASVFS